MPTTTYKGYEVQTTGSNAGTWGDVLNDNMITYVDANMGGITSLSLSASDVVLTSTQERNCMLRMTGTLTANVAIANTNNGFYLFENLTSGSFTVSLNDGVNTTTLPQSRRGVIYRDSTNGTRIVAIGGSSSADPIPVGTVMVFYQDAAPTGWTISADLDDYALKIVSSSGGVTSGSVAFSTLFARTATDSHVLTEDEIPSHTHSVALGTTIGGQSGGGFALPTSGPTTSGATGGGDGHTHDIDMRVQTASVILATKN